MTQYTINIGALPNDGTGDPLRTAFNEVNLNFDQVFAAGPVLSNIQIANNTILTTNTNGNLILAPNGIGKIQANVDIVPSVSQARNLGSSTLKWGTIYSQYISIYGDATINGNLSVVGNIIQIGNIVTDAKTIQLANTAGTANAANGSGITVGANDSIATMTYNSTSNVWAMNIGVSTVGNITAPYFFGNGSQLTGIAGTYSNANVTSFLAAFGSNTISTTGNITGGNIFGNIQAADGNTSVMFNQQGFLGADAGFSYDYGDNTLYVETVNISGKNNLGEEAIYAGVTGFTPLGSNVVAQLAGNATSYTQINFQNISSDPQASGDYIITANNGTDTDNFVDLGIAGNTWDGAQPNSLGTDVEANDGYLYVNGANLVVGTAVTGGSVKTWRFDITGNLNAGGNLVPKTSNAYSLGNATNQWNDLYVSNATIYMNNVPMSMTAGNVLTVNGQPLLSNDSNTSISTTGNITAGNVSANNRVITTPVALANLTAVAGARAFVSDGNLVAVGNFGAQIGGSGGNTVPAWSDGVNWYIG